MKRKNRTQKTIQTEEHHRRPRSLCGSDNSANVSYVPPNLHRCWHTLFGNMNAEQICNSINISPWKPEGITLVCKFINGARVMLQGEHNSKRQTKCEYAWKTLFKNMSFEETINYINNVWLDASYHFYVRK